MLVSIVIPAKNGERYLTEVLTAILNQRTDFKDVIARSDRGERRSNPVVKPPLFDYEIVIIDSGSTDKTLEIIRRFQNKSAGSGPRDKTHGKRDLLLQEQMPIRLFNVKPETFNHGLTRNFAISKSRGEFIALLTQDAIPATDSWLLKILEPILQDEKVAGVFGRHIPRSDCNPIDRRDIENHFKINFGEKILVQSIGTSPDATDKYEKDKHRLNFFSNTNSCIRRNVWQKIPFRKLDMAEDQMWAHDILMAGYKKAYAPEAAVYHSHNYTPAQYLKRFFDEYRSHKILQNYVGINSWLKILPVSLKLAYNDIKYIRTQSYTAKQSLKWSWFALRLDINRILGEYLGGHYEKVPDWIYRRLSMQKRIISGRKV